MRLQLDKKLYASVKVKNNNTKGELNYYLTEHTTYGLEIVKDFSGEERETKSINDVTESKEEINRVLGIMSNEFVKPDMAEEILNDISYK